MARDRLLPPEGIARESWQRRSSFVLGEYLNDHEATLEAFGLKRSIPPGKERAYLSDHNRSRRAEGLTMHTEGVIGLSLPDGSVSAVANLPEFRFLKHAAERIAADLDCEPGQVVSFLLTGRAFVLPWIEIETRRDDFAETPLQSLGPSFVIHVGSADVTAEEVRQAYVAAVRAVLGVESARALPAHVYPLVHKEAEGRLAGLTWRKRWEEWQRYAREWSITGHARERGEGDERTGYKTVESYRNYINKIKTQHEWIRRALETADAEREFRKSEEAGPWGGGE